MKGEKMRKYYLYAHVFQGDDRSGFSNCPVFVSDHPGWIPPHFELLRVVEAPSFADACRLCPEHKTLMSREKVFEMIEEFENAV